jgi:hypothetical protein
MVKLKTRRVILRTPRTFKSGLEQLIPIKDYGLVLLGNGQHLQPAPTVMFLVPLLLVLLLSLLTLVRHLTLR